MPLFYFYQNMVFTPVEPNKQTGNFSQRSPVTQCCILSEHGEFVWATYHNILAMTWKDHKAVSLISTILDPELGDSVTRRWKFA